MLLSDYMFHNKEAVTCGGCKGNYPRIIVGLVVTVIVLGVVVPVVAMAGVGGGRNVERVLSLGACAVCTGTWRLRYSAAGRHTAAAPTATADATTSSCRQGALSLHRELADQEGCTAATGRPRQTWAATSTGAARNP